MPNIVKLDKCIYYLLLLYALFSSISIAVSNIAISFAAVCGVIRYYKEPIVWKADRKIVVSIAMFLGAALISAIFAIHPMLGLERLWGYVYRMFPIVLAAFFIRNNKQIYTMIMTMALSIFISDIYAIIQGLQGRRATAFLGHPMILAGCLIQMIPLLAVLLLEQFFVDNRQKLIAALILIFSVFALLYNGTRGAWLAVGCVLLIYIIIQLKRKPKAAAVLIGVSLLVGIWLVQTPLIYQRAVSIIYMQDQGERMRLWHSAWQMYKDYPLTGVGLGNFSDAYHETYISPEAQEPGLNHAHNNFFHVLSEMGTIGFIGFLYMFGCILYTAWQAFRKGSAWGLALFLVTVSLLLQGLSEHNFGDSLVIRMFWCILGLALAAWNNESIDKNSVGRYIK